MVDCCKLPVLTQVLVTFEIITNFVEVVDESGIIPR